MSACTIDLKTARAICAARMAQTRGQRAAWVALQNELATDAFGRRRKAWIAPKARAEATLRTASKWARVRFVNGTTTEGILRCDVLKEWIRTGGKGAVSLSIAPIEKKAWGVKLVRGGSAVTLYLWCGIDTRKRRFDAENIIPAAALGAPIILTAPHDGGAFTLNPALPLP